MCRLRVGGKGARSLLLFLALLAPACRGAGTSITPPPALVASIRAEPRSFNRYLARDLTTETITFLTQSPLVKVDRLTQQIHALAEQLATSEADRAVRLQRLHEVTEQLATSEADRAARLEQIHALTQRLTISEADRKARLDVINALQVQLDGIRRSWVWRASRPIRPKERSG